MDAGQHAASSSQSPSTGSASQRLRILVASFRALRSDMERALPAGPARTRALAYLQESVIWARLGLEGPWAMAALDDAGDASPDPPAADPKVS